VGHSRPSTTEYRVLPWAEALALHGAEWLAIGREQNLNPSLLPDWTRIIVETLTDAREVRVLVGMDGAQLVSLVPFHIRQDRISRIPVRVMEPISSVMSYHAELVTRGSPEALLKELIQTRHEFSWDLLHLGNVLMDSSSAQAIGQVAEAEQLTLNFLPGDTSPYLHLETTAEKLLTTRKKTDRYNIRRHMKDFAAMPQAVERWYGPADDMEALLEAILEIEAGSWKHAAGVAISAKPQEIQYVRRLLHWLGASGLLFVNVCFIAGEPVAYNLSYHWEGRLGSMKGTYVEKYAHVRVGHYTQDQQIFRFADTGGKEFDFLGDAEPYKLNWSPTTRRHGNFFLYAPRGRGRWLGRAQRLRNRLRKADGVEL